MIRHCVEESNVDSDMNVVDPTKIRHVTVAGGRIALISGLIDPASHLNLDFPIIELQSVSLQKGLKLGLK
jgi:hypothetical protein